MENIQQLTYFDLLWAFVLILIIGIISIWESLKFERDLAIGVVRTVLQLTLMGYFLKYIFKLNNFWAILLIMVVMLIIASRTAFGRLKNKNVPGSQLLIGISLGVGATITTIFAIMLTVSAEPWWNPQYLLPLFGMILGNGMNSVALAGERLQAELNHRRIEIETLLTLGYSAHEASKHVRRDAIRTGLLPSINMMMVVGIVVLPGLMSGQIISGVDPTLAVKYQIMVTFMIAGSRGIACWILIRLMLSRYFTPSHQLKYWML